MHHWRYTLSFAIALLGTACNDGIAPLDDVAGNPADAVFVTSDLANFWQAYDAGATAADFQRNYIDKASPGLQDFIDSRSVTALSLAQMVQAFPQYFADIRSRGTFADDNVQLLEIREHFERIEELYPAAVYPPVTFLIGRFSTGGMISPNGMLIGMEFYLRDTDTPLDELPPFQRANAQLWAFLPLIVAHEHAHVLQARARKLFVKNGKTLLEQALLEGSADFVTELLAGAHVNIPIYSYGFQHEMELWNEFKLVMNGTNISQWLYNQGSPPPGRPGDLGYFIGYRIAQAYYFSRANQIEALRDIIEVTDAQAFLTASGYVGLGPGYRPWP